MAREGIPAGEGDKNLSPLPQPAIEEIAEQIQKLPGMPLLHVDKLNDPDSLTAKLLQHFSPTHSRKILTYFTLLNLGRLEEIARKKCAQNFYLLHPSRIAERTLAKSFQNRSELHSPVRYIAWAGSLMDTVIRQAVEEGDLGLFSDGWEGCSDPPLRRRLQVIAQVNNNLPADLRRISYLVFYEGRSAREIAKMLEYPLEQIEFILEQVFETVRRQIEENGK